MSWRTASYFSSRPTAATNPSHNWTAIPGTSAHDGNLVHSQRYGQAGALAQTSGESPQKIARFFCLKPSALHRMPAVGPVRRPLPARVGPAPAAAYTYSYMHLTAKPLLAKPYYATRLSVGSSISYLVA